MGLSKKPYKGTRDFFPTDKRIRDYLFSKMTEAAHLFGYEPYDGPMIEEVALYSAKSGEELINDQIYSFTDRGERFVAIRPEMTPTVARMVAQIHKEEAKPIRWYSIPNLMRYERPQRGRLREHWQYNCDIFGAPVGRGELEIIQLAIQLFKNLGANSDQFEIRLNDRRIVDSTFKKFLGLNDQEALQLYKIVDKSKKIGPEALEKELSKMGFVAEKRQIFDSYLKLDSFEGIAQFIKNNNLQEEAEGLLYFIEQTKQLGLDKYLVYDPTIVRGLDYYTGLVFEIFDKHPDNRRALCGGGAYADLLKIFNEKPLHGVGFGLGDVTLRDFLEIHNLLPDLKVQENDLFLAAMDDTGLDGALKLAGTLRDNGVRVLTHLEPVKFKKIFPLAEKKGARFVGILGEQEVKDQNIQIKDLETKDQTTHSWSEIEEITKLLKL
jgi:histidyl-tRNA synthetase